MGGGGSTYDYGFRIYNPQIAKFLSLDPLTASYPWYTPYQFAGNKPIAFIDLDGLEEWYYADGTMSNRSGPLTSETRVKLNLYSSDEIKQMYEMEVCSTALNLQPLVITPIINLLIPRLLLGILLFFLLLFCLHNLLHQHRQQVNHLLMFQSKVQRYH